MTSLTRLLVLSGVVSLSNALGSIEASGGEWAVTDDQAPPIEFAAKSQTEMGFDLYRKLAAQKPGENVCLSPISIAQAFALLAEGADGPVMDALAELLRLPADGRAVPGGGARFASSLMRLRTGLLELNQYFATQGEQRLEIVNSLWVDAGLPLAPAFQHAAAGEWAAEVHSVDFRYQAEKQRQRINAWVEKATQGHISELLEAGSIDTNSRAVISNALYFQANWEEPFPASRGNLNFTRSDGSKVQAPRMVQEIMKHYEVDGDWRSSELEFPYGSFDEHGELLDLFDRPTEDGVQILSYPYEGGRLSMDFLMPGKHDGLDALEGALDEEWLRTRLAKLQTQSVNITLPRFEVSSRTDLRSLLEDLGLGGLFSEGGLKNFAEGPEADQLYVSDAVHETWLRVNETGVEAAVVTEMEIHVLSETAEFRATRPFVYLIRDNDTGAVLFIGRMADPSGG